MNRIKLPAILMVWMEPPASLEEEFNDWYDTEHFPQRRSLPGFRNASRWVCLDGWPRWMALYDLESEDALDTDAYRAVSGAHSTPWSRRILPRTVGRSRVTAVELKPSGPLALAVPAGASRLLVMGIQPGPDGASAQAISGAIEEALSARADLLQLRGFLEQDGTLWMLAAFDSPVTSSAVASQIGRPCGCGISTLNLYVPYLRSAY
ncbi:DUF4286 family protein [Paraburkholderia agricolaris]|uniref:DUF4286 family protein n=1 Tax=Paraburkholderia agricolaris TaxID=2152888 RepID=UPI0012919BB6|nr:DUF4286 family protein [Paraburkholderia agricolaris]